jgi:hypothetical protein
MHNRIPTSMKIVKTSIPTKTPTTAFKTLPPSIKITIRTGGIRIAHPLQKSVTRLVRHFRTGSYRHVRGKFRSHQRWSADRINR